MLTHAGIYTVIVKNVKCIQLKTKQRSRGSLSPIPLLQEQLRKHGAGHRNEQVPRVFSKVINQGADFQQLGHQLFPRANLSLTFKLREGQCFWAHEPVPLHGQQRQCPRLLMTFKSVSCHQIQGKSHQSHVLEDSVPSLEAECNNQKQDPLKGQKEISYTTMSNKSRYLGNTQERNI